MIKLEYASHSIYSESLALIQVVLGAYKEKNYITI
jgi:hypothetical protein